MRADPAEAAQLGAQALGEAEVRDAVPVEVADLARLEPERELAAAPWRRSHAGPRGDLGDDLICCRASDRRPSFST